MCYTDTKYFEEERVPFNGGFMTARHLARIFLAVFLLGGSAQAGIVTKQLGFAPPAVSNAPGGVLVTIPGCRSIADPGEPILPVYAACFLLPPGESVARVIVEPLETVAIEGSYAIAPMPPQAPLGTGAAPGFTRNTAIYASSQPFPTARGELATEQTLAGVRLAFVNVHPCAFVPSTGTVLFSSSIRVTIETAPAPAPGRAPAARTIEALRALRGVVENPGLSNDCAASSSPLAEADE